MCDRCNLHSTRILGVKSVGYVREYQSQHVRGALLQGTCVDVRPISEDLDGSSYPSSRLGCDSPRAVVDHVADNGCADAGVAGNISSGGRTRLRRHPGRIRHGARAARVRSADQTSRPFPRSLGSSSIRLSRIYRCRWTVDKHASTASTDPPFINVRRQRQMRCACPICRPRKAAVTRESGGCLGLRSPPSQQS
jgi:hypothetical protein